jgi:hypothetical protein
VRGRSPAADAAEGAAPQALETQQARVKKAAARSRRRKRASVARRKRVRPGDLVTEVTAADLRSLRNEMDRRAASMRWNPAADDVQRSVAQLVLTIVEFLRKLMERQAIRRMEQRTLSRKEVEAVGAALMELEKTIIEIGKRFGLAPEDLNLDLGPLGKLM